MTIVLESYADGTGLYADISQDKYCKSFDLYVYEKRGNIAMVVYKNRYLRKEYARKAIRRNFKGNAVKTFDYWKDRKIYTT